MPVLRETITQAYEKSKKVAVIKHGVGSLEWLLNQPAFQPYVAKAASMSEPYLDLADERADAVAEKVSSLSSSDVYTLVDKAWFDRVNEILSNFTARMEETVEKTKARMEETVEKTKARVEETVEKTKELVEKHVQSPADRLYKAAGRLYLEFALAERAADAQEFLRALKVRVGEQWNEKLETPIREFLISAKEATLPELMKMFNGDNQTMSSLVGASIGLVRYGQETLANQWNNVLQCSQDRVDKMLPPAEDEADQAEADSDKAIPQLSLTSVSGTVSKRLQARALAKIGQVKALSQERLQEMRHFDLQTYASTYLDGAKTAVEPKLELVVAHLEQVQSSLNAAMVRTQDVMVQTKEVVSNEATQRLQVAKRLGGKVRSKITEAIALLPAQEQLTARFESLPATASEYLESLLAYGSDTLPPRVSNSLQQLIDSLSALFVSVGRSEEANSGNQTPPAVDEEVRELGSAEERDVDPTIGLLDEEQVPVAATTTVEKEEEFEEQVTVEPQPTPAKEVVEDEEEKPAVPAKKKSGSRKRRKRSSKK